LPFSNFYYGTLEGSGSKFAPESRLFAEKYSNCKEREKMARLKIFFLVALLLLVISPLSVAQTPISAQRTQKLLETVKLNKLNSGYGKVQTASSRFTEVEILLNNQFSLADISALMRAPGSDLKVLDDPKRVVVQLPASTVEALLDAGAEINVKKNFILFEGAKSNYTKDGDVTIMGSCTGPYQEAVNNTRGDIPDYPGSGEVTFTCGRNFITGAPVGSTVKCIDVGFKVNHSSPSDLVVLLTDWDMEIVYPLWEFKYASPGEINETKTGITEFKGELVNQTWVICLGDFFEGNTGHIESWWIKVYYPEDSTCSGIHSFGENDTDVTIPSVEGITVISQIDITDAPTHSIVDCIDLHYEINHYRIGDLEVLFTNSDGYRSHHLWNREGGSTDNINETVNEIAEFTGEPVNQTWNLKVIDHGYGVEGYIDYWWIKVYYGYKYATCSGTYSFGENDTNVAIPDGKGTPAISQVDITDAPPGSTVNCIEVNYEIKHNYVGDLEVLLTDSDGSHTYTLWNRQGGSDDNINEAKSEITEFNGELVNQTWKLEAIDHDSRIEGYIDSWWIKVYYGHTNDNCSDAIAVEEGIPYRGTMNGATGVDESSCGDVNDVNDVWHLFTPNKTGLFTISLAGSNFDTTLAVFDQCEGMELACNDYTCETDQSEITMIMNAGNTYLIRVAGFEFAQGDYILTVTGSPPILPTEPESSIPLDGANDVLLNPILSWSSTIEKISQAQSDSDIMASSKDTTLFETIYGKDDRLDQYEVVEPNVLATGDATVAFVPKSLLVDNDDGTFSLPNITLAEFYLQSVERPLCFDEAFCNQPSIAWCSGFLVAPDIIATAGHCICPQDYSDLAVVFGFVMRDANTPVLRIYKSETYYHKEVIARNPYAHPDWALMRLDREVTGHYPLPLRHIGIVPDDEPLLIIGHPMGLPMKYAAGATVRDNSSSAYFKANLDSYQGNSGSPVLNANTLVVEGILYFGPENFVQDGFCDRSVVCPDTGCPEWPYLKYVTRATEFSPLILTFDVYLGTDTSQLNLICSDVAVPWCDPGPLQAGKAYYWNVVAKNCYGQTEGPIWSFTTATK